MQLNHVIHESDSSIDMSKYDPLKNYLRQAPQSALTLKFSEIEQILGFDLPHSAYKYASWWANSARGGAHMKAWRDAGWEVSNIDLSGRRVTFQRRSGQPVRPVQPQAEAASAQDAERAVPQAAPAREEGAGAATAGAATSGSATPAPRQGASGEAGSPSTKPAAASGPARREAAPRIALVPEEAIDLAKLPGHARRLLESRARLTGRTPAQEAAAALGRMLMEERQRLVQRLKEIRGRTIRPGSFDLLAVLGRSKGGE